jgi:CheY-specific phosphatase CheX
MTDVTTTLREVSQNVLADCAFLLTQPANGPAEWPVAERLRHATIDFEGLSTGTLSITTTVELAETVACDMLGLEAGDTEAATQAESALGELVNVVAGALVARLFGTASDCRLGLPKMGCGHPHDCAGASTLVDLEDLEGRPVRVRLCSSVEPR